MGVFGHWLYCFSLHSSFLWWSDSFFFIIIHLYMYVSMRTFLNITKPFPSFAAAIPINKQLYSISYVCLTAGAAGIVFSVFYLLVYICTAKLVIS